jgi:hypothetical protein
MGYSEGMKGKEKEGLEEELRDRKTTNRAELRFSRLSNVETPCEAERGEDCAIISEGWMPLRAVAKLL